MSEKKSSFRTRLCHFVLTVAKPHNQAGYLIILVALFAVLYEGEHFLKSLKEKHLADIVCYLETFRSGLVEVIEHFATEVEEEIEN